MGVDLRSAGCVEKGRWWVRRWVQRERGSRVGEVRKEGCGQVGVVSGFLQSQTGNLIVFVVYRHVLAMVLVGPFAYVLERLTQFFHSIRVGTLQGVVISALAYYLQAWCISHKGPVFAAMFSPLQVITVAMFSAIAVAERLHFGSLIGALLIIVGLYCVLWGKRKNGLVAEDAEIEK
ncbi:WAT1-related protein At1g21890-like [Malus sylvestris]|uniref:WAT1-related protein At1g21890-like n=1 Tax=Malus sylvestris TaxID=3752 RepID=UPI0021AC0E17|nr:WAT1-related protein At1g21890-like [Malus sylvestris]